MKNRCYIGILLSHLAVMVSLCTPIIVIKELQMDITGKRMTESYYVNIFQFVLDEKYSLTAVLMMILCIGHIVGIVNAVYGLAKNSLLHRSVNVGFVFGYSSALMGALLLYTGSYGIFTICAASFFAVSYCSVKLMKEEKLHENK